MNNMEIFNIAVAEVFGQCFANFPMGINFDCVEIAIQISMLLSESEIHARSDIVEREANIVYATIKWLEEAGYIWINSRDLSHSFYGVILAPKGLEVLNVVPDSLNKSVNAGNVLSRGIKEVGMKTAKDLTTTLLSFGAKYQVQINHRQETE